MITRRRNAGDPNASYLSVNREYNARLIAMLALCYGLITAILVGVLSSGFSHRPPLERLTAEPISSPAALESAITEVLGDRAHHAGDRDVTVTVGEFGQTAVTFAMDELLTAEQDRRAGLRQLDQIATLAKAAPFVTQLSVTGTMNTVSEYGEERGAKPAMEAEFSQMTFTRLTPENLDPEHYEKAASSLTWHPSLLDF